MWKAKVLSESSAKMGVACKEELLDTNKASAACTDDRTWVAYQIHIQQQEKVDGCAGHGLNRFPRSEKW
jgi:hypothetical protein